MRCIPIGGLAIPLVASLVTVPSLGALGSTALEHGGRQMIQAGSDRPVVLRVDASGRVAVRHGAADAVAIGTLDELTPWDLGADRDSWVVAATRRTLDGRERLALFALRDGRIEEIRAPRAQTGARRTEPVLLAPENLMRHRPGAAIAWLEGGPGPRSLSVSAAVWDGDSFGPPLAISERGGSQTGLAGATLDDGRHLLVWSAFDGEDHEIVWSLGNETSWSPPARLAHDNRVPDITPTVVATRGGALAAWSHYDGNDYRLAVARFDGTAWQEPLLLAGRGLLDPELVRGAPEPLLSALQVAPRAWLAMRFDPTGESPAPIGVVPATTERRSGARPVIATDPAGALRLTDVEGARR